MSTQVAPRRKCSYATLQEIIDDATRLAAADVPVTGNWSKGQIFDHLARLMDYSLDGFSFQLPWFFRVLGKHYFKARILKNGMLPGIKLKGDAKNALSPESVDDQTGLEHLRLTIQRLISEPQRFPSPFFGELSREEWDLLHCRHAELHMSFIAEP
tara:strand:- start:407 stop:874 length:468 start_codon:yes stop_codon:yes gene_type:complete